MPSYSTYSIDILSGSEAAANKAYIALNSGNSNRYCIRFDKSKQMTYTFFVPPWYYFYSYDSNPATSTIYWTPTNPSTGVANWALYSSILYPGFSLDTVSVLASSVSGFVNSQSIYTTQFAQPIPLPSYSSQGSLCLAQVRRLYSGDTISGTLDLLGYNYRFMTDPISMGNREGVYLPSFALVAHGDTYVGDLAWSPYGFRGLYPLMQDQNSNGSIVGSFFLPDNMDSSRTISFTIIAVKTGTGPNPINIQYVIQQETSFLNYTQISSGYSSFGSGVNTSDSIWFQRIEVPAQGLSPGIPTQIKVIRTPDAYPNPLAILGIFIDYNTFPNSNKRKCISPASTSSSGSVTLIGSDDVAISLPGSGSVDFNFSVASGAFDRALVRIVWTTPSTGTSGYQFRTWRGSSAVDPILIPGNTINATSNGAYNINETIDYIYDKPGEISVLRIEQISNLPIYILGVDLIFRTAPEESS